jgi:ribosome-binding ATPase YchF (GTP1/OBG family)
MGNNAYYKVVEGIAAAEGALVLPICAKTEAELPSSLEPEERQMFLEELGLDESGLDRLIKCSYTLLGLISFLTCGADECRAWTIKKGTKAPQAAGKIHSDIERGFIRAEIIGLRRHGAAAAPWPPPRTRAWSAARARTMSCRTAT